MKDIEILMLDRCTKSEAERFLFENLVSLQSCECSCEAISAKRKEEETAERVRKSLSSGKIWQSMH